MSEETAPELDVNSLFEGEPGQVDLLDPEGGDLVREGPFLIENARFAVNEEYSDAINKNLKEGEEVQQHVFLYLEGTFADEPEPVTITLSIGKGWRVSEDGQYVVHPDGHERFHATTGVGKFLKRCAEEIRQACTDRSIVKLLPNFAAIYVGLHLQLGPEEYKGMGGEIKKRTAPLAIISTDVKVFEAYRKGLKAVGNAQQKTAANKAAAAGAKSTGTKPAETKETKADTKGNGAAATKAAAAAANSLKWPAFPENVPAPKPNPAVEKLIYETAKNNEAYGAFRKAALSNGTIVNAADWVKVICQESWFDDVRVQILVEEANAPEPAGAAAE